jgi:hypothetical protein
MVLVNRPFTEFSRSQFACAAVDLHALKKGDESRLKRSLQTAGALDDMKGFYVDAKGWLPFAAEQYQTSSDISDYIAVPVCIMPSEYPNKNGVGFPLKELSAFNTDTGTLAYKTWRGKPTHQEHCFGKDTLVLTSTGYKSIKEVEAGDMVYTHKRRWRPVVRKYNNGTKPLSAVVCQGIGGTIFATKNHPFWVIDKRQLYGTIRNNGGVDFRHRRKGMTASQLRPHFRPVTDMYQGDYLVIPVSIGGEVSPDSSFAFLAGVYAAEGSLLKTNGAPYQAVFTLGFHEDEYRARIEECLQSLGYKYVCDEKPERGVTDIRVKNKPFAQRLQNLIGEYSHLKHLRGDIRQWDQEGLMQFLGGYVSGDGCTAGGYQLRCRTSSKKLAYDVQMCLAAVGILANCTRDYKGGTSNAFPNGKTYPTRPSYHINATAANACPLNDYVVGKPPFLGDYDGVGGRLILLGKYLLAPILKIRHGVGQEKVYNLEVEEDNTYVADNVIVHNCNQVLKLAKGVIFESAMRPLARTKQWKVINLCGFDRTKDPVLANAILKGESTNYSMGAFVRDYECSVCAALHSEGGCDHVELGKPDFKVDQRTGRLTYLRALDILGFETSAVEVPAFVSAEQPKVFKLG